MAKSGVFTKEPGDVRVQVTYAASEMIGLKNIAEFVRLLMELMGACGANRAYVGKRGSAVDVWILRPDGWQGRMKVPVTRRR